MAISTWSAHLLLAPAPSSRIALPNHHRRRLPPSSHRGLPHALRLGPRRPRAYISAPAPAPDAAAYAPPTLDAAAAAADVAAAISASDAVTWAGVWQLLSPHRARLAASLAALLACTTCTLSMPLFSGRFFETLIGRGAEPLWRLLQNRGALHARARLHRYLRCQHDCRLGEGHGQAAEPDFPEDSHPKVLPAFVFQITGTLCILFTLSTELAPVLGLLMVRSFGGEKRQISLFDNLGKLSVGTMASFIGYTFTLTFAVQGAVNTLGDIRGTFASIERINSILSAKDIDDSLAYGLAKELDNKELEDSSDGAYGNGSVNKHFMSALKSSSSCNVYFSYPLRSDVEILNGLDLTIECGKVTALVGPNGAGKSTVVQLLAQYYEPTQGCITVAGEDIRLFDKREWSRVVSLVNQGYDTLVGERGGLLSGGQRQRIAIARALLKNAPILILDEATSALDATSERLVQEALNHLMKGRTSLVIAHRLSTVQNAHRIAVCSEGKITELGTHAELLAKGGSYASLVGTHRLAFE
ncbi:hypothetical protein PR202_gb26218 [Eleusine coracana subsp. coracana]|uniref:ABC transporter domain-containing protein n=1 Tax=Eleusine coracana subsp. coracana TaxID=191504 RepID=A0AAV5FNG9_ELECO|nr:hypothetical protein PR202_gb26218 [Eleusine coracana subsp. coracana]